MNVAHGGVPIDLYASPSKVGSIETMSPNAGRLKQIAESPSWRRGETFVRQSQDHADDPFITSANSAQAQNQGKHLSLTTSDLL